MVLGQQYFFFHNEIGYSPKGQLVFIVKAYSSAKNNKTNNSLKLIKLVFVL